jgi:hypothetical protein
MICDQLVTANSRSPSAFAAGNEHGRAYPETLPRDASSDVIAAVLQTYRVERVLFHGVGPQENKERPTPGDYQCDSHNACWPFFFQRISSRQHRSPMPKEAVVAAVLVGEAEPARPAVALRVRAGPAAARRALAREMWEAPPLA